MEITEFKNIIWDYSRKINENINNVFSPICEQHGLTMLQIRILMDLYKHEYRTIGNLAEGIFVAGANISAMCKKLESMGFLKRVRDQKDERIVKVTLTEKGNEIVSDIDRFCDEKISQNIDSEMEEALDDIIKGVKRLNELMQKIGSVKK